MSRAPLGQPRFGPVAGGAGTGGWKRANAVSPPDAARGGELRPTASPRRIDAALAAAFEKGPIPALLFEGARLVTVNEAAKALLSSSEVSVTFLREVQRFAHRDPATAIPSLVEGETRRFRVHAVATPTPLTTFRVCFLLPVPARTPADFYLRRGLTRPEMRVADLLLEGMSNRRIAAHVCRSVETIRKHVSHILRKCGVPNRTAFVAAATGGQRSDY